VRSRPEQDRAVDARHGHYVHPSIVAASDDADSVRGVPPRSAGSLSVRLL
jgi:hypothetical protein